MNNMGLTSQQKGMTLIEIMIALILGVFIIAGVIHIFLGSKQTYRMQENFARLQENGRFAMDFISRDIRMADSLGCLKRGLADISKKNKTSYPAFAVGVNGIEGSSNAPDTITLVGIEGGKGAQVTSQTAKAGGITVTSGSDLMAGDIALVADCNQGDIFKINSVSGNVVSQNVSSGQDVTKIYGSDASIYPFKASIYSIGIGSRGQLSLFRALNGDTPKELVEGVEDMQILYGVDTNADHTPEYYVPANQVKVMSNDMDKVVSIRIKLLVATVDDNLATETADYTFNGITKTDRKLRREFASTIAVRNRLP
jgi:type IV pilus assembly protein PilW